MSINKSKERVASLIGNVAIALITVILTKDTFPRIVELDIFSGDRKKFKVYESQCRMYL
jgi:hypothetical protein